jgi:hypothetical protein
MQGSWAPMYHPTTSEKFRSSHRAIVRATMIFFGLVLSSAVLSVESVQAADEENYTLDYGKLKKSTRVFTFQKTTALKRSADQNSKTVAELPAGTSVTVVTETTKQQNVNGFEDFWYQVKTDSGSNGYVWGGNLSKSAMKIAPNKVLVLAIEGKGKDQVDKKGRAILFKDNTVTSEATFKPIELPESHSYGYSIAASKFNSNGFSGNPFIARFYFMYGACDYPNGDILFAVTGDKVTYLLEERNYGNEVGGSTYEYTRPSDKGGKPNMLLVDTTVENREEKKKNKTRETFRWEVDHFVKQPARKISP